MDHPLLHSDRKDLRRRVIQLLKKSYSAHSEGNIIFVCGGNEKTDMRPQFREFCQKQRPDFKIFFPEYAIKNYFSEDVHEQFDIADFETLIGSLSHAIVVFPEAAGSFAETGYFSAIEKLASKTVLSLNAKFEGDDSFISLGPAKKIAAKSKFQPAIQTNYVTPDFEIIVKRIDRIPLSKRRKALVVDKFDHLFEYELFCLIHQIFYLLNIATFDDLKFIFRAIFKTHFKENRLKQVTSILVGANHLVQIGEFGHYCVNSKQGPLLRILPGHVEEENSIKLELTALSLGAGDAFREIWGLSLNAA